MLRVVVALCVAVSISVPVLGGPIHDACKAGDIVQVKKLLEADKALLESVDANGWTPLHSAASEGRLEICRFLIGRGANVNHADLAGNTPLVRATVTGRADVTRLLLEKGARTDTKDMAGSSPLLWAACSGSVDTVKVVLEHGATLKTANDLGHTPLHQAAFNGHLELVRWLIGQKCELNAKAQFDVTPLHRAVEADRTEVVKALIAAGADVECRRTEDGNAITPLMQAARDGRLGSLQALLSAKAQTESADKNGGRALGYAASNGHLDCVQSLLRAGADPNRTDKNLWGPLLSAATYGRFGVVEALVLAGAKVDARNTEGNTALTSAALNNHLDVVEYLIAHGANVNNKGVRNDSWPDNNAETALHFGVRSGNPKIVEALLKAGADPKVKDGFGEDAIAYAVKKGQQAIAEMMARKVGQVAVQPDIAASQWQLTEGANGVGWEGEAIHVWHRAAADTDHPSFATFDIPFVRGAPSFRLEFSVRFGKLQSLGASVDVLDGSNRVLFVAADGIYGKMAADLGGKRLWERAGDSEWHAVALEGSDGELALTVDGNKVGAIRSRWLPSKLTFGSRTGAGGRQTEAWLRLTKVSSAGVRVGGPASRQIGAEVDTAHSLATQQLITLGGVDTKARAPLLLTRGDRPRVNARTSVIQAHALSIVEFAPVPDRPDFVPVLYTYVVNGKEVQQIPLQPKEHPVFSLEVPAAPGSLTRVKIVGTDIGRVSKELQRAEVRTADPAKATSVKLGLVAEKVILQNLPDQGKGVFLFAGSEYLGQLTDPRAFAVDARRIPPGQHEFYVVATNSYGDLLPATRSLIEIKPRYTMSSPQSEGVFTVEGAETAMPWTVGCMPGAAIAKTQVFVRGTLVGENDKPTFEVKVPLSDVPSGSVEIEVVGFAADGTPYPRESHSFTVRNPFNDSLIARDSRGKTLQEMIARMSYYDQQVVYWYERAIREPAFRTYISGRTYYTSDEFGRMSSIGYLDTFTVQGQAQEFFARCRAAIVERAAFRLEIGKLQKKLGLRAQARSTLAQVKFEAGEGSGLGLAAAQEMVGL